MQTNETDGNDSIREDALRATLRVIQPIVGLLLEAGASCGDVTHLVRWTFVQRAAARQLAAGKKPSASRIAASTGLTRSDVRQLLAESPLLNIPIEASDRARARVMTGWKSDPDFLDDFGNPKVLAYADATAGIPLLVRRYARDIPPRAMVTELLASGLVEQVETDRYRPCQTSSRSSASQRQGLDRLGQAVSLLAGALASAIKGDATGPAYHVAIVSERLAEPHRAKVIRELDRRCRNFSGGIERFLLDQPVDDSAPLTDREAGARVGILVACVSVEDVLDGTHHLGAL